MSSLDALTFSHGLDLSMMRCPFSWVDVVIRSMPFVASSIPYLVDKFWPPSTCVVVAPIACAAAAFLVAFAYFVATFATFWIILTCMTACSLCFCWAN